MSDPVPGHRATAQGDATRQVELYGEPWSVRLARLLQAYRLSQAKLGAVIGLSAPMVSQLMSGQRAKITNPAVFGRIVRLEEHLDAVLTDPGAIGGVLQDIAAATPTLTTVSRPAADLAGLATPEQFRVVAAAARSVGADRLADVMERAAGT